MIIKLPSFSLVCLMGVSGSGKSTFARQHFRPTEILSSDHFRALVSDDEADQSVSRDAFSCLYYLARKRLKHRKLTVIDATSVHKKARLSLIQMAQKAHCPAVAVILDLPLALCLEMNSLRPNRQTPAGVVEKQARQLAESLADLPGEKFFTTYILRSHQAMDLVKIVFDEEDKKDNS
ncbi:MAG: AAA family ATPase [Deltaproteobacteria bacterium]|jgi:protein phosphatase|nr:AAA family ATPase [Deltaproteobacteria bacterium]